ncbi:hypothetical protein [Actinomadura xylanilytica]|uniref:hypothetical protein n=1 Tax=Actinomadura xylanilytica TaxID=887459 RepID=UPI00255AB047|nr:hypothetical protein [Actinomadura xylanilytica]MDL4771278.1 hypothetical protein [Actinomadura xylanilytica]
MTTVIASPRRAAVPAPPRPARRHRALPWLLAAGWLAQVLVRLWFARARTGPVADPDETGYLAAARWLAGGPGADLSGNTFYQGGYPLLLTPAYWASHDPAVVYTLVIVINALIGATLFPLAYAAARRLGLGRRAALPSAWAGSLLPAATLFGSFALADAVLPVLVLGWLLALDRFVRRGRAADAVIASLAVTYATAVHTRGEVLLAVHAATFAALAAVGPCARMTRPLAQRTLSGEPAGRPARLRARFAGTRRSLPGARACLIGMAVTLAGYAAGSALNDAVRDELYPGGVRDLAGILGERLTTADGQQWALSGAAGQIWYLVVSSWGLAGAGLVAVAAVLVRRRTRAGTRIMAAVLLASTFGVAYASSAALPDEHRVGNFAYGRYLACLALAYTLAGAAALLRGGLRAAAGYAAGAAAVTAGTALCVTGYAGERLRTHTFIAFDFPETIFLTGDGTALRLTVASCAALGLLAGFLLLGRGAMALGWTRRYAPAALAAALAAVCLAALTSAAGPSPRRAKPVSPLAGVPERGGVVTDLSLAWPIQVWMTHPVWWTRIGRIDTRSQLPAPGVCTVVVNLPAETAPAATWPQHPAGWLPRASGSRTPRWVAWYDPSCAAGPG